MCKKGCIEKKKEEKRIKESIFEKWNWKKKIKIDLMRKKKDCVFWLKGEKSRIVWLIVKEDMFKREIVGFEKKEKESWICLLNFVYVYVKRVVRLIVCKCELFVKLEVNIYVCILENSDGWMDELMSVYIKKESSSILYV